MKNYYVYIHTNKINNKKYVGITCQNPKDRWDSSLGYKKQKLFWAAIQKYGWDNFEHYVFPEKYTDAEAKALEISLIAQYHTCILDEDCCGYNMTRGGEGGQKYLTEKDKKTAYINRYKKANKKQYEKLKADKAAYSKKLEKNKIEKRLMLQDIYKHEKLKAYNRADMANRRKSQEYAEKQRELHRKTSKKVTEIRNKLINIYNNYPELLTKDEIDYIFARSKTGWKNHSLKKLQAILNATTNLLKLYKRA